jgi:ankyrin repeat protein
MKPLLFTAAKHGETHILEHELHADNIDTKDKEKGYTLLCYAAGFNQKNVLEFLLKQNANINIQGGELNQSPLMLAIERNHHDIVAYLLADPNIDVTLIDAQGRNALMQAVLSKNIPAITALISKTDLSHIDNFADTVFYLSDDPAVNNLLVPYLPHQP